MFLIPIDDIFLPSLFALVTNSTMHASFKEFGEVSTFIETLISI